MKNWQNTDKRSVFFSLMKRAVTAVAFIMLMVVLILGIFPANRAEAATPGAASIEWPYYIGTGYEINTNHEVYRYSASGATRYHCAVKIISGAPDPANTNEAGTLLFDYPSTTETSQGIPISNNSSYCGLWVKLYARGISSTNDYGTAAIKYVQIKPLTPTLSNPTQANGTVSLSWSAASGAASYKVYRSESASTGFYEIASTTSRSYSETLPAGTYYYKVIAAAKTTSLVDVRILSNGIVGSFSETKSITIPQSAQVATPTPNPLPGTYTSAQNVILSCATSGATIRYTTNGNEPTSSSTQYISPITVSATTTIKAKAFKSGMTDSITGTFAYTINSTQVATPTASPSPGTYSSTQSITLSCATSGATIRYTTNNSEPTSSSTQYTNPISVSATTTIKAKAFRSGLTDSATGTFTYTIGSTQVATPTASPSPGSYNSAQSVTLSCTTSGATIRYTTNNSEPTGSSTQYTSPIAVSATTTIKAKAFRSGMTDSATGTFAYTINATRVGTPTASPLPGSYTGAQSIVLNCPTSGATIRYTTNNAEPTSS
ncbi:MAG: chitobiase/beta-hexosaminidase C-terminal domain-containing protein, partial [Clostridiales bacterium]|nr:chitobiase/beta-hexosaminidase C-terminal domain-containing protein [Clostridiales bacterium]